MPTFVLVLFVIFLSLYFSIFSYDFPKHWWLAVLFTSLASAVATSLALAQQIGRIGSLFQSTSWDLRDNGFILGERTFLIDDQGIATNGPNVSTLVAWGLVMELELLERVVLFWTDPGVAVIVPRSAIGGEEAVAELIAFTQKHIAAASSDA